VGWLFGIADRLATAAIVRAGAPSAPRLPLSDDP
jgi:hypothetical protein